MNTTARETPVWESAVDLRCRERNSGSGARGMAPERCRFNRSCLPDRSLSNKGFERQGGLLKVLRRHRGALHSLGVVLFTAHLSGSIF